MCDVPPIFTPLLLLVTRLLSCAYCVILDFIDVTKWNAIYSACLRNYVQGKCGKSFQFGNKYTKIPVVPRSLLQNNSVFIREVSFGEREYYITCIVVCCQECVLYRGVSFLECPFTEGPL